METFWQDVGFAARMLAKSAWWMPFCSVVSRLIRLAIHDQLRKDNVPPAAACRRGTRGDSESETDPRGRADRGSAFRTRRRNHADSMTTGLGSSWSHTRR